ncbi:MAG: zf-HC2 domain-containing protein [Zoogloeaceae bacterium]|nr:zf-HC2 domain-containing protein [Zoogloeaceae bacterium]
MLNCRQATQLCSEERDRPLSLRERVALRLHTLICDSCANFRRQMDFLALAARRFREGRRPDGDDE